MRGIIHLFALQLCALVLTAQVGVGTSEPHTSSILDVESSTKGFLPPRLASDANVDGPAEGLVIYDETDDCLNVFNGSTWINFCDEMNNGGGGGNQESSVRYSWETDLTFSKVMPPTSLNNNNESTVGIGDDGVAYAWGHDNDGTIQSFDPSASETTRSTAGIDYLASPWKLSDPNFDGEIKQFVSYDGQYLVLTNSGDIYTFGKNTNQFVDAGSSAGFSLVKPRLKSPPLAGQTFANVKISGGRVIAVMDDGKAYLWGRDLDNLTAGANSWREIAIPNGAAAGFEYTQVLDNYHSNASAYFLKGNDGKVYSAGLPSSRILGSNGGSSTQSFFNSNHINELIFPASAGEIVELNTNSSTAVAFDDKGNTYAWGNYANSTTIGGSTDANRNFVIDTSQTPSFTNAGFTRIVIDPVLVALPDGETSFVSFGKVHTNNIDGAFFVGASGVTYFIGNNQSSSIESVNLFTTDMTGLEYVSSISAAHVDAVEVYHHSGYVGLLDREGKWYYFGEEDVVNVGGFQTPNSAGSINPVGVGFKAPLALPLERGDLDTTNNRP